MQNNNQENWISNNKGMIIIPELNKQKVQAADKINGISAGLIISTVLLTHRAQLAALLQYLSKQEIQKLDSMKWNAKQIAKHPRVRETLAKLVIADTFNFEISRVSNLNDPNEIDSIAQVLAVDLFQSPPDRNSKALPSRAINPSNVKQHRQALLARYIGTWQARPLFDPVSIVKNIPVITITPEILGQIIIDMHITLNIKLDSQFSECLLEHQKSPSQSGDALIAFINIHFTNESDNNENNDDMITFNDMINLNTPNNLAPIEDLFKFIRRPLPEGTLITETPIAPNLLSNPLLSYSVAINDNLLKEQKKQKQKPGQSNNPFNIKPTPKRRSNKKSAS